MAWRLDLFGRHCARCRHRTTCDYRPVLDAPHDFAPGPCPVISRLTDYIADVHLPHAIPFGDSRTMLPAEFADTADPAI